ncbi:MAG: PTS system nitrogen regulatory IIA component [bacterium]|nr:MAG: PTS system nitrogen regulatory IIA component [bacterium]KAF0147989.1 MAG: PTS system nitrogen regulatory IIA component [bacterium]KAF0167527.1 MAG: PTS system nitrogen regulatory IIA component [bacterium]TXT20539.1 MAG: PTS system nitrogen regulatory IIA component [bacterium]
MNRIAPYLEREDILLDVDVASAAELFAAIDRHMAARHGLPPDSVEGGLRRREQLASTGLGQGFAIPHCRVLKLDRVVAAYVRLRTPLPFAAPDGLPVSEFLVLLVPKQASDEHLEILADAARLFSDQDFRASLRRSGDAALVQRYFTEA